MQNPLLKLKVNEDPMQTSVNESRNPMQIFSYNNNSHKLLLQPVIKTDTNDH